jgi:Arabinose-binding domain of AraC transcription regulator, N-term
MADATVSAGVAASLIELAVTRGAPREPLHQRSGISVGLLQDRDNRVPMRQYFDLVQAAKDLTSNPAFGLDFGTSVHMQEFSVVGLIFHACETVRDARACQAVCVSGHRLGG